MLPEAKVCRGTATCQTRDDASMFTPVRDMVLVST